MAVDMIARGMASSSTAQSEQIAKLESDIAEAYDETATYASGDYAMFDGVLKKYNGETWNVVKVTDEIGSGSGDADWDDIFPQIESDDLLFDPPGAVWTSEQVSYDGSTVKDRLDELKDANGIEYEQGTVKTALDERVKKDEVAKEFINRIETSQNESGVLVYSGTVPTSSTDEGTIGQVAFDSSYVYLCVADNTWIRLAITDF